MTMSDIVVVMSAGEVAQVGTPLERCDQPANHVVAGFIGSPAMNFLPARLTAGVAEAELGNGVRLPLPEAATETRGASLGVRPEYLGLTDERQGIPMLLDSVEPTGPETFLQGHFGGPAMTAQRPARVAASVGETLHLTTDAANLHMFDAGSLERFSFPA